MWYTGQKIVCIEGGDFWVRALNGRSHKLLLPVTTGAIYTVRDLFIAQDGTECLRVFEVVNEKLNVIGRGLWEPGYRASRFRPLVSRPTDISELRKLLEPELTP